MAKIFPPLQKKKDGLKCGSGPVPGQQYFPNQWKKFGWLRPTPRKGECELLNSRAGLGGMLWSCRRQSEQGTTTAQHTDPLHVLARADLRSISL